MKSSRRELGWTLAACAAGAMAAEGKALPSRTFRYEDLKVRENGKAKMRDVLNGETHSGFALEMHITELPPGGSPHPPHRHVHEEMMCVQRGTLEAMVNGEKTTLAPGSVFYIHSNDEHGVRNPGTEPVQYFVIALGSDKA